MGNQNKRLAGEQLALLALPQGFALEDLCAEWGEKLWLFSPVSSLVTVWDSFEWQLWRHGLVLWSSHGMAYLCERDGGWIGKELVRCQMPRNAPRFGPDFSDPSLAARLASLLGLRGLAPVGEAFFKRQMAELRNEREKKLCGLESLTISKDSQSKTLLASYARVLPLRSNRSAAEAAAKALITHGAEPTRDGPLEVLFTASGNIPRVYTLRPIFGLDEAMPARLAVGKIVRAMLELAKENELRITGDVDTEFLHHYRICLRKIRSVLSLLKGVYPGEETLGIRKVLGKLANETNRLRDLDVYLVSRSKYTELLPKPLQDGLGAMFKDFESERAQEMRKMVERLKSPTHRQCLRQLETFFDTDTFHEPTTHAETPLGRLIFARIYKRYKRIRRTAHSLCPNADDGAVHQIRVECKKLRYLMEFFAEVIPTGSLQTKEKQLRKLQDKLGAFNDCSVQQASLMAYWEKKRSKSGALSELALSLGGLISILHVHHKGHRKKALRALAEFCSGPTAGVFKKTFKHPTLEA